MTSSPIAEEQLEELRPLAAVIEGAITDTPIRLGTDDWGTMLAATILARVAAYIGGVLPPVVKAGDWLARGTPDLSIPDQAPPANQLAQRIADEEQTLRLLRRESLLVLLTRLQRGRTLSETEADTLRQHVETEIREADTSRSVAAGNKRHVQLIVPELERAEAARAEEERLRLALAAERDRWKERAEQERHERDVIAVDLETADRVRAEAQRDRDQHAAVLTEVLATFVHQVPGYRIPRVRSGEVDVVTLDKWRSVVAPTAERPWWVDVAEIRVELEQAQAAIDRVRAHVTGIAQTTAAGISDYDIGRYDLAVEVVAVLDGTDPIAPDPQPTTES